MNALSILVFAVSVSGPCGQNAAGTRPVGTESGESSQERREPLQAASLDELLTKIEARTGLRELKKVLLADLPRNRILDAAEYASICRRKRTALDAIYRYGNRLVIPLIKYNLGLAADDFYLVDNKCLYMLLEFEDITPADIREIIPPFLKPNRLIDEDGVATNFGSVLPKVLAKQDDIRNLPTVVQAIKTVRHVNGWNFYLQRTLRDVIFHGPRFDKFDSHQGLKSRFFPYSPEQFGSLEADEIDNILKIYNENRHRLSVGISRTPIEAKSLPQLLEKIEATTGMKNLGDVLDASISDAAPDSEKYAVLCGQKRDALRAVCQYGNRTLLPVVQRNLGFAASDEYSIDLLCMFILYGFHDIGSDDIRTTVIPLIQADRLRRNGRDTDFAVALPLVLGKHNDIRSLPGIIKAICVDQPKQSRYWLERALREVIFYAYDPGPEFHDYDAKFKRRFFPYKPSDFGSLSFDEIMNIRDIYEVNKGRIPVFEPPDSTDPQT